jgi:MFS family permease
LWQKDFILLLVGLSAAVVGAYGPMLSPGFVPISAQLNISVNTLSQSTAWLILTLGATLFIANPFAKVYGKRPVYVLASVLLLVASIWGATTTEYNSFLASRIVGGLGMAPYEVLVQATIGDLYFVHQRATRIAAWNLFLLCGIAGGSLISGYIIEDLGYRWTFGVCAIFFGIFGVGIVLAVPETAYKRSKPQEAGVAIATEKKVNHEADNAEVEEKAAAEVEHLSREPTHAESIPKKMSYWRSLRIFSGRYTRSSYWLIFARPFVVFFYPAILWAFLIYGTTLTWIVVFSVVNGVIFVEPPYNFSVGQTGLISLSPFILTIIGELISGPINDWICLKLAKRNHGIYEPEFRLVLMTVVALLGTVGFYGFGATVHYQTHWSGPVLTFGLANMALAFASTCVFGYVLDAYPKLAEEAFVAINARNFLTFGLTYFVNDWLAKQGALAVFSILGSAFLGVVALTIPLWIFGKRIRSWISRNKFLNDFMTDVN